MRKVAYSLAKFANFVHLVLRAEIAVIFGPKIVDHFPDGLYCSITAADLGVKFGKRQILSYVFITRRYAGLLKCCDKV